MNQDAETEINERPSRRRRDTESPIFNEPIPEDAERRQLDRRILESYDATQERIRAISSRQTRIEVVLESVQRDLKRLEEQQSDALVHLEKVASSMSAISNKLSVHTEMEKYQWTIVNDAHAAIKQVGEHLDLHLGDSKVLCERVAWIEKLFFLFVSVFGVMFFVILSDEIMKRFFGG